MSTAGNNGSTPHRCSGVCRTINSFTFIERPLLFEVAPGIGSKSPRTLISTASASRTLSATLHIVDGESVIFQQRLQIQAKAWGVNSTAGINAPETAYFDILTSDPLASYQSASGTVFSAPGASVPVPGNERMQ